MGSGDELSERAEERGDRSRHWTARLLFTIEDWLLVLAMTLIMLLPLVQGGLRGLSLPGISGASSFVQHLTLIIGMLGGAVAARQQRLLTLSTVTQVLSPRWRAVALIFSSGLAAAITGFLGWGSMTLVAAEKAGGQTLAYNIPVWAIQLVMPIGFGLIALRLLWFASDRWWGRLLAAGVAGLCVVIGVWPPFASSSLVIPALAALVIATGLGAPVFTALGGIALILFWGDARPIASIASNHYALTTNATLPTIPLFTLAGYFLAKGGASRRLIRVFETWVGGIRGGPAIVCALVCAFFTSFTGASGVTILALGGLLMPVLLAAGYKEKAALGLLTGSGSLGLLFPPCLPLILYAIIAQSSLRYASLDITGPLPQITIEKMFVGGIFPGILLVGLTAWWGVRQGPESAIGKESASWKQAWRAVWDAKWELLLPVVALGSLLTGYATAVEASALTAFYAFLSQSLFHRDREAFNATPATLIECGLMVGGVLLILGVAMGLTKFLIFAGVPAQGVDWISEHIQSKWLFLLVLNVFLLVAGCLMDIFSALVVLVPLIVPIGLQMGVDPIHLGIIFLANLELGYLTPPVGLNLFLASYRFDKPMPVLYRAVIPMFLVLFIGVLLITYLPFLTTFLPGLLD